MANTIPEPTIPNNQSSFDMDSCFNTFNITPSSTSPLFPIIENVKTVKTILRNSKYVENVILK